MIDKIQIILGCMFSGKTTELIRRISRYQSIGMNTIINKSSITSNFVASLELAKNGLVEVKQKDTFGNIFIRSKTL